MLLDADGHKVKRTIGFWPPVFVRVGDSTPEENISLIGESTALVEDESGAETRKKPDGKPRQ